MIVVEAVDDGNPATCVTFAPCLAHITVLDINWSTVKGMRLLALQPNTPKY